MVTGEKHRKNGRCFFLAPKTGDVMIEPSEQYAKIANELIRKNKEFEDIRNFDVRIAFLASDKEKTKGQKLTYAECVKVDEKYQWTCPYDFMIIVYEPNVIGFTPKQLKILMRHELKHVGVDLSGYEPKFNIVQHDIEDFKDILKKYGLDWSRS